MFTLDPATGDERLLVIEASLGLGESVVSGAVSPDRYVVQKDTSAIVAREVRRKALAIEPSAEGGTHTRELDDVQALAPALTDDEVRQLAELGLRIERHYDAPQDTEWAFDPNGAAWILQARPVTTAHAASGDAAPSAAPDHAQGAPVARGLGAAPGVRTGPVRVLRSLAGAGRLADGDVLVAPMTAPDWVPLLRRAAALVTDAGGMTCHAAIVSRELGIPCVVGTGDATRTLRDGELVTVDGSRGQVHAGARAPAPATPPAPTAAAPASAAAPVTGTELLVNLSEPSQAERAAALPVDGVGLLRAELMLLEALGGDHPRAAAGGGPRRGVRGEDGAGAGDVRVGVRAAPGDLPHDRLPHERVPRPARRRALRAGRGEPDDRLPRCAALPARARRLPPRARRDRARVGRGPPQPPRDAAVRAHARASSRAAAR